MDTDKNLVAADVRSMDTRWGLILEETHGARGAFDNSPQFQLRVLGAKIIRPSGTVEVCSCPAVGPS